jgi:cyclopropane-fatty-acyl-phospholipid synthase
VQVDQRPVTTPARPKPTGLAAAIATFLGDDIPVRIDCYDGTHLGPEDALCRLVVSRDALTYILTAPGELGFARAYVAGALELDGDIFEALALRDHVPHTKLSANEWLALARVAGAAGFRWLPAPREEARLHGRRHSKARDAAAIAHHYDVSNDFYRIVLGPSMTYSCAVWPSREATLEDAQASKYELVCRKLDLRPGMRLLDVGCGWGGMVMHAARHYDVDAVGVTLSQRQAAFARAAVEEAGLGRRVDIRVQDYRDIVDGPFDAVSSIGMFEHVGLAKLDEYFRRLFALIRPGGRLLNHGIARVPDGRQRSRFARRSFIDRYVFPDGELHEVGSVISRVQLAGFEARNVEGLREHYALTLRAWVRNLEDAWDRAVAEVGPARARVWRLYMAASAVNFEVAGTQVHQVLAVRPDHGRSGMPLRPDWELVPLTVGNGQRAREDA